MQIILSIGSSLLTCLFESNCDFTSILEFCKKLHANIKPIMIPCVMATFENQEPHNFEILIVPRVTILEQDLFYKEILYE